MRTRNQPHPNVTHLVLGLQVVDWHEKGVIEVGNGRGVGLPDELWPFQKRWVLILIHHSEYARIGESTTGLYRQGGWRGGGVLLGVAQQVCLEQALLWTVNLDMGAHGMANWSCKPAGLLPARRPCYRGWPYQQPRQPRESQAPTDMCANELQPQLREVGATGTSVKKCATRSVCALERGSVEREGVRLTSRQGTTRGSEWLGAR